MSHSILRPSITTVSDSRLPPSRTRSLLVSHINLLLDSGRPGHAVTRESYVTPESYSHV